MSRWQRPSVRDPRYFAPDDGRANYVYYYCYYCSYSYYYSYHYYYYYYYY